MSRPGLISPVLKKNLAALARIDAALARRLCLPVEDGHVARGDDGQLSLRVHRTLYPLAIAPDVADELTAGEDSDVLVFGVGLGELVAALLRRRTAPLVTAWERDPWLLRLALSAHDFSAALQSRRLRLALGIDIVGIERRQSRRVIRHPLLGRMYRNDAPLLGQQPWPERALVSSGTLFVDDVADSLRELGLSVYTWDLEKLSREELVLTARRFDPAVVVAVNYTHGLAELCHEVGRPLLCWEIDPATDRPRPIATPTGHVHVFTYRKAQVTAWQEAGYSRTTYMPLAAGPKRRTLVAPGALDERYAAPVAFVGASCIEELGAKVEWYLARPELARAVAARGRERVLRDHTITARVRKMLAAYSLCWPERSTLTMLADGHSGERRCGTSPS